MLSIYLILGAFAGLVSGLFGVGGGVVVIPALATLFACHAIVPVHDVMQMAIGTSLAIMVFTTSSALYAYHQRRIVRWDLFRLMFPGLVVGALLGSLITRFLPSTYLQAMFGIFLSVVGIRMLFNVSAKGAKKEFSKQAIAIISGLIGMLSSVLGVSGGVLVVPFLLYCGVDIREATGTSVACGLTIGVVATISLMITGFFTIRHLAWSTGYIYWPAFLGVVVASTLFAPVGTRFAHQLPKELLKRIFGLFLLLMACDMLLASIRT